MRVTPAPSQRMAKSNSLSVLEHDTDMHIVDQDDIIGLTQDVKNFSDGLAKLKGLFTEKIGKFSSTICIVLTIYIRHKLT